MTIKKLMAKTSLIGLVMGAILTTAVISGCAGDIGHGGGRDSDNATISQGSSEPERGESSGEHGSGSEIAEARHEGREGRREHGPDGEGRGESNEAAMSSPITPLGQSWSGVLGGLDVSMQYDAESRSVHGTVRNTLSQRLCYVQAEPHLKSGTNTVGELGPEKLGHLNPGQEATTHLAVAGEPALAGVSYNGYVVHMEVFDCGGPGSTVRIGQEGAEARGEHGGEEGSDANSLSPDETLDEVRGGARLTLSYDPTSNTFEGAVKNTSAGVLSHVRIEVHLSNGAELGPTTPADMAPGEVMEIVLPATPQTFTGWTAHAEAGTGGD